MRWSAWTAAAVLMLAAGVSARPAFAQRGAHQHGVATLQVALDGAALQITLAAPMADLVGFEHAPRTAAQTAAYRQAGETLRAFDRLFRLPAAAACTLGEARLQMPYPAAAAKAPAGAGPVPAGAATAKPADGVTADAHADVRAEYALRCAAPQRLDRVEVLVFDVFEGMREIRAEKAGPRGQGAARLTASRRSLPL